jgi:amino acid transporter
VKERDGCPQFPEALSEKWTPAWITWGSSIVWFIVMGIFIGHPSQDFFDDIFVFILFAVISFLVIFNYGIGCSLLIDRIVHRLRLRPVFPVKVVLYYTAGSLFGLPFLNDWDQLLFMLVSPYTGLALLFFTAEEVRNWIKSRRGG